MVTHLAGEDDGAYWTNLNWTKAVAAGMASVNAPFSGKVDFIETDSSWPITHMVAPARMRCAALNAMQPAAAWRRWQVSTSLAAPSDHAAGLDTAGWALAVLTLLGVLRFTRASRRVGWSGTGGR